MFILKSLRQIGLSERNEERDIRPDH